MGRPSPQQARARTAIIEARLRNGTPLHRSHNWELYRSNDGFYLIRFRETRQTLYVVIRSDGEVLDPIGYPVDGADIQIAISCLRAAGLTTEAQNVISWPLRRRR